MIVSQRVSSVRDADLICVMSHGSVAGLGTHDELLKTCPLYEEICLSQLKREELGGAAPAPAAPAPAQAAPSAPVQPAAPNIPNLAFEGGEAR